MSTSIQTHSGKIIDLIHPDPFLVNINDIAHALANLCRFGGHTKEFYSVANHSLLVALHVPAEDAFAGLMHDATEAYCQDLIGPLKALISGYRDIEAGFWEAIAWKYRLPENLPQSVKDMDYVLCTTEIRDLLNGDTSWMGLGTTAMSQANYTPLKARIQPLSRTASRSAFLKHFHFLKGIHNAKKR